MTSITTLNYAKPFGTRRLQIFSSLFSLGLLLTSGCGVNEVGEVQRQAEQSSELQTLRDAHYALRLTTTAKGNYKFVVCHLAGDQTPVGCVNAFLNHQKRGVTMPKQVIDSYRKAVKAHDSKEHKEVSRKLFFVNTSGLGKASIMAGGALGGGLLLVKVGTALVPVLFISGFVGVAFGGYHLAEFLTQPDKDKPETDTLSRAIGEASEELISEGSKQIQQGARDAAGLISEGVKSLDHLLGQKAVFHLMFWGEKERSLASGWHKLISDTNQWPMYVWARVPDMLPLLAQIITDLGWAGKGVIREFCLPERVSVDAKAVPICLPMSASWNTGGALRYVRPTN